MFINESIKEFLRSIKSAHSVRNPFKSIRRRRGGIYSPSPPAK